VLIGVSRGDWRRPTDNIRRGPRQQCLAWRRIRAGRPNPGKGA